MALCQRCASALHKNGAKDRIQFRYPAAHKIERLPAAGTLARFFALDEPATPAETLDCAASQFGYNHCGCSLPPKKATRATAACHCPRVL